MLHLFHSLPASVTAGLAVGSPVLALLSYHRPLVLGFSLLSLNLPPSEGFSPFCTTSRFPAVAVESAMSPWSRGSFYWDMCRTVCCHAVEFCRPAGQQGYSVFGNALWLLVLRTGYQLSWGLQNLLDYTDSWLICIHLLCSVLDVELHSHPCQWLCLHLLWVLLFWGLLWYLIRTYP